MKNFPIHKENNVGVSPRHLDSMQRFSGKIKSPLRLIYQILLQSLPFFSGTPSLHTIFPSDEQDVGNIFSSF
jgi:hypothetical protein